MNNVYLTCQMCKTYLDAGYRWAALYLERPQIVEQGRPVSVSAVFSARTYWEVPPGGWPTPEHLLLVRQFLLDHYEHNLIYGDSQFFLPDEDSEEILDWMEIGAYAEPSVRALAAQEEYLTWNEVVTRHQNSDFMPYWFHDRRLRALARQRFEQLRLTSPVLD